MLTFDILFNFTKQLIQNNHILIYHSALSEISFKLPQLLKITHRFQEQKPLQKFLFTVEVSVHSSSTVIYVVHCPNQSIHLPSNTYVQKLLPEYSLFDMNGLVTWQYPPPHVRYTCESLSLNPPPAEFFFYSKILSHCANNSKDNPLCVASLYTAGNRLKKVVFSLSSSCQSKGRCKSRF